MKNILLLGASGSIGTQVLDILREHKEYNLVSIAVGENIKRAKEIIDEFKPKYICVKNEIDLKDLRNDYPDLEFGFGEVGLIKAATYSSFKTSGIKTYLINAVVGMVGLIPTIEAIKVGNDILLANKETLVVAGKLVMEYVEEYNVRLVPIDSEHSTIYQCLFSGKNEDIKRIIITASGGSFRDKSLGELRDVSVAEALQHPNWQMGAKITIDSATMVNKGLEVIEAHYLFNLDYDKIETILHYESIIHSMVEYNDGTIICGLSYPDMRIPIAYALNNPRRYENKLVRKLDLTKPLSLNLKPMDFERFPLLELAYEVGRMGGLMPMIYNSANEVAVGLFLDGKIKFLEIAEIIKYAVNNMENIEEPSLEEIIKADKRLRKVLLEKFEVK